MTDAIKLAREALEPLARIWDEYQKSKLDEHRPEWGDKSPDEIELVAGRGGKRLLTLADAFRAHAALSTAPGESEKTRGMGVLTAIPK